MADLTKANDKFFRASMQNQIIAQEFFQIHLPEPIQKMLNMASLELENSTYIDSKLQEVISDLVFTCRYNKGDVDDSETDDETDSEAKVVLLIEHQSTPDRFMAFRVYHYLFNMLYTLLKQRPKEQAKDPLPPVYALVFYHGKQTPYPYSMNLTSCFDDPLGIMNSMFNEAVPLIDVNQISDDELQRQHLVGIMTGALKHIRDADISPYLLSQMGDVESMDLNEPVTLEFIKTVCNYLFIIGNIADIEQFLINARHLPEPIRGEFMTTAEKLQAMGVEKGLEEGLEKGLEEGLEKGKKEVAINLLKEDVDPQFIARISGIELSVILELKAQLEEK